MDERVFETIRGLSPFSAGRHREMVAKKGTVPRTQPTLNFRLADLDPFRGGDRLPRFCRKERRIDGWSDSVLATGRRFFQCAIRHDAVAANYDSRRQPRNRDLSMRLRPVVLSAVIVASAVWWLARAASQEPPGKNESSVASSADAEISIASLSPPDKEVRIARLIGQLGADSFRDRAEAARQLADIGPESRKAPRGRGDHRRRRSPPRSRRTA